VAANVVLVLLERNLKTDANVMVASECTIRRPTY